MGRQFTRASSQYIDVGTSAVWQATSAFTAALWYYADSLPGTGVYYHLLTIGRGTYPALFRFEISIEDNNQLNTSISVDGSTFGNKMTGVTATTASWRFAAARWENSGDVLSLFDNTTKYTATVAGTNLGSGLTVQTGAIGRYADQNAHYHNGRIGQLAFWKNKALTDAQITALANRSNPLHIGEKPDIYMPLYALASPEPCLVGSGVSGTVTGATATTDPGIVPPFALLGGG